MSKDEIKEIIKALLEYDGSVSGLNHEMIKKFVYKNAFNRYGILVEEIEEGSMSPWNGRLSHGGSTSFK